MSRAITIYGKEIPSSLNNVYDKEVIDLLYSSLTKKEKNILKAVSYVIMRTLRLSDRRKIKTMELIYFIKEYQKVNNELST